MNVTYQGLINKPINNRYNPKQYLTFKSLKGKDLNCDTVSFNKYKNILPDKLKEELNPKFEDYLLTDPTIHDIDISYERLTSFSKYLKEQMVGFITPEGEHWFDGACKYLILASAGVPIKESRYEKYAEEFWTLMAKTDTYWSSKPFINYLETLNQNDPGVKATLSAINKLNKMENTNSSLIAFTSHYISSLTNIKELLDNGCAYSGEKLSTTDRENFATIEHLFPHSAGGDLVNVNSNYVLINKKSNQKRGDIPLTAFLKGWDAQDYKHEFPDWKVKNKPFVKYTNHLSSSEREKHTSLNIDFKNSLINDENYEVHNLDRALSRIQNLSRYLKEEMVGFVTPAGEEWFEGACEYLIKGTAGTYISEKHYDKHAMTFWTLMAKADSYWESPKFLNYLNTLEKNPGVNATINAVKSMMQKPKTPNSQVSFGYSSQLRFIPELLKSSAFSDKPMTLKIDDPDSATVDHIFPNSIAGDNANEDCNYLLISAKENSERGNMSLLEYLMGWTAIEFEQERPGWLSRRVKTARKNRIKE